MDKEFEIKTTEFSELCQYVCHQLVPSGFKDLDRKTLNFGIYWQMCTLFDQQVNSDNSSILAIQQNLQDLLNHLSIDSHSAIEIVNKMIDEVITENYQPTKSNLLNT